jgi:hypothetical protein
LNDSAVTSAKIADGNVDKQDLASNAVDAAALQDMFATPLSCTNCSVTFDKDGRATSVVSGQGGGVTGGGTKNFMTKFTGGSAVGDSQIVDTGLNIGVGTAAPQSTVHVRRDGVSLRLDSDNNTGSPAEIFLTESDFAGDPPAAVDRGMRISYEGGASVIQSLDNGFGFNDTAIGFITKFGGAFVDAMGISAGGDVGLGTFTPLANLDIHDADEASLKIRGEGESILYLTRDQASPGIPTNGLMVSYGGDQVARFQNLDNLVGSAAAFVLTTKTNGVAQDRLTVTAAGRIGIGNNNPLTTLDVNGTVRQRPQLITVPSDGAGTLATFTITPTSSYVIVTCQDTNGCQIFSIGAGVQGQSLTIMNSRTSSGGGFVQANGTANGTASYGTIPFNMGVASNMTFLNDGTKWVEISRSGVTP